MARAMRSPIPGPISSLRRGFVVAIAALGLAVLAGCAGGPDSVVPTLTPPDDDTVLAPGETVSFRLEPFSGAPGNLTDDLTRIIGTVAEKQKLKLIRRPTEEAVYRIRGNLSAVGDDSGTTVIYVFSVYNRNRRLVHQIHGQEVSKGSRGDPWAGVQNDALHNIAIRTVDALKAFVASRDESG